MIIRNATYEDLQAAATAAKVVLAFTPKTKHGRTHQGRILPDRSTPDTYYRRLATNPETSGNHRRLHAVCWHGHLHFFRALYDRASEAVVRTGSPYPYKSREDLEALKDHAWRDNLGSWARPVMRGEACTCSGSLPFKGDHEPVEVPAMGL